MKDNAPSRLLQLLLLELPLQQLLLLLQLPLQQLLLLTPRYTSMVDMSQQQQQLRQQQLRQQQQPSF
ncbi:hypothetical protein Emag_004285 [Eimeria magna]